MIQSTFRSVAALLLFLLPLQTFAQQPFVSNPVSENNPEHWSRRRPDAAYWQQDVRYNIGATIDEAEHSIAGDMLLDYWNNSPDTLRFVYFHLYQNAFVEGSYLRKLEREKGQKPRLGKQEAQGNGTVISHISVDNAPASVELDNTIMKVYLPKPLAPGGKTNFFIRFKTWWDNGSTRRRMQMYDAWGWKHYNGVQWYPKVCVYDRKAGWDTYQHLNKEFYGEFGTYEVTLNFPSNYVVEATGALQNRQVVLPDELRQRLDMKNFANKPWGEAPSTITPYVKGERKTWHYLAYNVHDFAFTADPSYRIASTTWNGVECVGIAQEPHASGWQNSAEYVAKIIKTFSQDFGQYRYPKMVAADASDGMEYPMLTLDGGRDPQYHGLLVHEIGHNWFYGMVGSNETYRAALDEGFTQFLTAWGMERIDRNGATREGSVLLPYTMAAMNRAELPLNTHSNDFHDALAHEGGYGQVYYKTATMLYNLQYTLGDSLFQRAMQHYFQQWLFAHPYFEDFRASIIQFTKQDLNWFFDQWIETTKTIDYSVGRIRKGKAKDAWNIDFRRRGLMQMPVDFRVTARDGRQYDYHIPNTWFEKATSATVLPKWWGWSKIQPRYTANVEIPGGIRSVQIDPSYRLADAYYPDNYRRRDLIPFEGVDAAFDKGGPVYTNRRRYQLGYRPDIWYNPVDGIKAGLHIEGDYLNLMHRIDATVWFNTHLLQDDRHLSLSNEGYYERYAPVHYSVNYSSPLLRRVPKLQLQLNSRFLDGLWLHRGGLQYAPDAANTIRLYAQTLYRPNLLATDYLIYPAEWSGFKGRPNSSLNLAWTRSYNYVRGTGTYTLSARAPFLGGNNNPFDYSYAQLEAINYNRLGKLELRTRLFGRWGTGTRLPDESLLWAAGANPEALMEDKYTRSYGVLPQDANWSGINRYETGHFQQGGGLNLRGYAGYLIADERGADVLLGYKSRSGAAFNAELDVDGLFDWKPKLTRNWLHLDAYFFGDAGLMELSRYTLPGFQQIAPTTRWSDLRLDGGAGFALTVKKWGRFAKAKPLTLRIDFPVFLNRPPFANPQYAAFRYVVGINRTF